MRILTFLCSLLILTSCTKKSPERIFIGTYTGKGSNGIYTAEFNEESGSIGAITLAAKTDNPSFVTTDRTGKFLYAVNELGQYQGQPTGAVSAFEVEPSTGLLKLLNQIPSSGAAPCHLSLDQTGKFLFVANYMGGNIAVITIEENGSLGALTSVVQFSGTGPHQRQDGPHAHYIQVTPDNNYVLAADLGTDKIMIYRFDASVGLLRRNETPFAELSPGAGPRHLVISGSGKIIYVLNELNGTVTVFDFNPANAGMAARQIISTLPSDFSGSNTAAEVVLSPDGRYLYTSNRGHDSIAQFAIDKNSGDLALVGWTPCGGNAPRHIQIDPAGQWMIASNQNSNNLALFRIEATSGKLTQQSIVDVSMPVCVQFLQPR